MLSLPVSYELARPQEVSAKQKGASTFEPAVDNYKEGLVRFKAKDWDGAVDSFLQATYFARNNFYPEAFLYLGLSYKAKKQDSKAIEALVTHLDQVTQPDPDGRVELAEIYIRNGRYEEAERQLNRALGEYKGHPARAHYMYGKCAEAQGELSNARTFYLNALDIHPWKYTEAWMALANIYLKMKEYTKSLREYDKILENQADLKNIDFEELFLNRGACQLAKGDHQGALESWRKAESINPDGAKEHLYLGNLFDIEKHIASAISEYRNFVRLAPESKEVPIIKKRILELERMVQPNEALPEAPKPSPYMRQQQEQAEQAEKAKQQQRRGNPEDAMF